MIQTNTIHKKVGTKENFNESPNANRELTWEDHLSTYVILAFLWTLHSTGVELNIWNYDDDGFQKRACC